MIAILNAFVRDAIRGEYDRYVCGTGDGGGSDGGEQEGGGHCG